MARVPRGSCRRVSMSFLKNVTAGETTFPSSGMRSMIWAKASEEVAAVMYRSASVGIAGKSPTSTLKHSNAMLEPKNWWSRCA